MSRRIFGSLSTTGCAAAPAAYSCIAFAMLLCITRGARAQTTMLDRVVASVGGTAITQSDVQQECRFEDFVSRGRLSVCAPNSHAFKDATSRLINQKLLEGQLGAHGADSVTIRKMAVNQMADIQKKFHSEADFHAALHALGIDSLGLLQRLEDEQRTLQMIDDRMRPAAAVSSQEIQDYYQKTLSPELRGRSQAVPPLAEVQNRIREILVQKKITQLLDSWLAELRTQQQVEVLPP